jgi:pyridoxal/pyridoxine/pyridoxamine kinase
MKITSIQDGLLDMLAFFHRQNKVPFVFITSVHLDEYPEKLCLICSQHNTVSHDGFGGEAYVLLFPKLKGNFSGVGDLMSAIVLGKFIKVSHHLDNSSLREVCSQDFLNICIQSIQIVQKVLLNTIQKSNSFVGEHSLVMDPAALVELALIESIPVFQDGSTLDSFDYPIQIIPLK